MSLIPASNGSCICLLSDQTILEVHGHSVCALAAMVLPRRDHREMSYYDFMNGLTQEVSYENLMDNFGELASSTLTVFKWLTKNFVQGDSPGDETRTGRPITAATTENAEAVRKLIKEARITVEQFQDIISIKSTPAHV